jgi:hypothetical protein
MEGAVAIAPIVTGDDRTVRSTVRPASWVGELSDARLLRGAGEAVPTRRASRPAELGFAE